MSQNRLTWEANILPELDEEPIEYEAYNERKECVGALHYENVGRHMHWCWYQTQGFRMSPGCLQEVRDKQKELCLNSKSVRGKDE